MAEVKGIPYGKSRFDDVRRDNCYYVDKTMFLPMLEETGDYLFLIRPRRFGKSLFVSMMSAYYDKAKAKDFDTLFDGLWIKEHPTPLKNAYQVIYFDFSMIGGKDADALEKDFDVCCGQTLDIFAERYASYYDENFVSEIKAIKKAKSKLTYIKGKAQERDYKLYLIVDEYDNFTNVILSKQGTEKFRELTHANGFYRDIFKVFKAMFSRIFLIGVSPVTLDDLTSGYNIDWGISQDPRFNAMLGFSDSDVRQMLQYYKDNGKIRAEFDVEEMLEEMRPWYDNYCFAKECLSEERVFNSDMVLYYLRNQILYKHAPEDMVDKNIKTDYSKLRMLAEIARDNSRENRMGVLEDIAATGELIMPLKTSFPAEYICEDENFRSLIYYYGMLTMGGTRGGRIKMIIPNRCVQEQYWGFMRQYYDKSAPMQITKLRDEMDLMAFDGDWEPLVERIAQAYKDNSSVRDSILGEHNLQGFFKAYLSLNPVYILNAETELNYGYSDFLLMPDLVRYPDVAHAYIMELKYVKPTAADEDVRAKELEAEAQLKQYAADAGLVRRMGSTQLHLLKVVFRGADMQVCEECDLH